jgi:anti-anti-sigma regulatory factor
MNKDYGMAPSDNLEIIHKKGYVWATLPSSIKRETSSHVLHSIRSHLSGKNDHLALDCSMVSNIYSVMISVIMTLRKQVIESSGSICLVNVSKRCFSQLLSMCLENVLTIYQDENDLEPRDL